MGENELSVKELMGAVGLKDRHTFIDYSLSPAIANGLVRLKYENSPRHPRQKYLLTVKGQMVYEQLASARR